MRLAAISRSAIRSGGVRWASFGASHRFSASSAAYPRPVRKAATVRLSPTSRASTVVASNPSAPQTSVAPDGYSTRGSVQSADVAEDTAAPVIARGRAEHPAHVGATLALPPHTG